MPRTPASLAAVTRSFVLLTFVAAAPISAQLDGYGQSFTAPSDPLTVLQQLSVQGFLASSTLTPFTVNIFPISGLMLTGPSLFTQSLGTFVSGFSLIPNLPLTAGGHYAVLVTQLPPLSGNVMISGGDFYAGGQALVCSGVTCFAPFENPAADLEGFSVRFGTTTAPEPATWALVATGLLTVGGIAAWRKRAFA